MAGGRPAAVFLAGLGVNLMWIPLPAFLLFGRILLALPASK